MTKPLDQPVDFDAVMNHPPRVQKLRGALDRAHDAIAPLVDLARPYVTGLTPPNEAGSCWWATTLNSSAERCC